MKIVDKFILKQYLTTFFFCLLLFLTIIVVVDISEHTDDFVQSKLSTKEIFTEYYLGFIPRMIAMLFPLFVFIAVIFFTSKMAGRSEIIAILSSGVTFNRFMRPFFIGGAFLTLLLWAGYLYVVPKANRKWADFDKNYIKVNTAAGRNNKSYKQNMYFTVGPNAYVGIKGYDTLSKTGIGLFVQDFEDHKLAYNLRANTFRWDSLSQQWKLENVIERTLHPINESVKFSYEMQKDLNFKPIALREDNYLKDQMTTRQLNQFIEMEKARGSEMVKSLLVEKHNRLATPVSVFILTLIGVSIASKKTRGGSGAHLALGVLISVMYILFGRFSMVFASQGNFTPWLAAWTPNIIFGLLAIYLYRRASA